MTELSLQFRSVAALRHTNDSIEYKLGYKEKQKSFYAKLEDACQNNTHVVFVDKHGATVSKPFTIQVVDKDKIVLQNATNEVARNATKEVPQKRRPNYKCVSNGMAFDSRKEAAFAAFLTSLNLRFEVHPITIKTPPIYGHTHYTPDFYLTDLDTYVEIKPKRPDAVTMSKCAELSKRGSPVICMFGKWQPGITAQVGDDYQFRHADGFVGMMFKDGQIQAGVTCFTVLDGQVHITNVTGVENAKGCSHPCILAAFKAAQNVVAQ